MNTELLIAEIQKLPADQKQVVRDFVVTDQRRELAAALQERSQGPFVPFDPEDEAFFKEICEESEKMLQSETGQMARSFSRHPALTQDLARIRSHIAPDNRDAADRVIRAILRAISLIKASPEVSSPYPIGDPSLDGILRRKVVTEFKRRYLIFYTVTNDAIRILYTHQGSFPIEQRLETEPTRS